MAVMGGATAPSRRKAWLFFLLGFFRSRGPWKRVMKRGPPGRWSGLTWDERGEPPSGELNMIMTQLEDSLYLDLKQNALYLRSLFFVWNQACRLVAVASHRGFRQIMLLFERSSHIEFHGTCLY